MFDGFKNKITSAIGRQILVTQKNSPTMLLAVGVVGVVATAVLASQATLKMDAVLREAEEKDAELDLVEGKLPDGSDYSEDDRASDKKLVRIKTIVKIAKLYAPAVAVGAVSIFCLTSSHIILTRRNVGLSAAYATVAKGYADYRKRVVEQYGLEKDVELRYGVEEVEIAVETDEGPVVKTVKRIKQEDSEYAVVFNKETSRHWSPNPGINAMFVQSRESFANDALNTKGFLMLNSVYEMLGMHETTAGSQVGWVVGNGDNRVSFNIFNGSYENLQFINGTKKSVVLDFNVDGEVYQLLDQIKRDKGK